MKNTILAAVIVNLVFISLPGELKAEDSPVYGNSSTRGVTNFQVPGQVRVGGSRLSSFRRYSTGINRSLSDPRNSTSSQSRSSYKSMAPRTGSGSRRKTARSPLQINSMATGARLGQRINSRTKKNTFSIPTLSNKSDRQIRQYRVKPLPRVTAFRTSRNIFSDQNMNLQNYASSVKNGKMRQSNLGFGVSRLKNSLSRSRLHVNKGLAAANTMISRSSSFRRTGISTPAINRMLQKR